MEFMKCVVEKSRLRGLSPVFGYAGGSLTSGSLTRLLEQLRHSTIWSTTSSTKKPGYSIQLFATWESQESEHATQTSQLPWGASKPRPPSLPTRKARKGISCPGFHAAGGPGLGDWRNRILGMLLCFSLISLSTRQKHHCSWRCCRQILSDDLIFPAYHAPSASFKTFPPSIDTVLRLRTVSHAGTKAEGFEKAMRRSWNPCSRLAASQ